MSRRHAKHEATPFDPCKDFVLQDNEVACTIGYNYLDSKSPWLIIGFGAVDKDEYKAAFNTSNFDDACVEFRGCAWSTAFTKDNWVHKYANFKVRVHECQIEFADDEPFLGEL